MRLKAFFLIQFFLIFSFSDIRNFFKFNKKICCSFLTLNAENMFLSITELLGALQMSSNWVRSKNCEFQTLMHKCGPVKVKLKST